MVRVNWVVAAIMILAGWAMGMASVDHVASKGNVYPQVLAEQWGWPAGVMELVNDPLRTEGWLPWFSELPNDVNHFQLAATDMKQVNGLIRKLAAIDTGEVRLVLAAGDGKDWLGDAVKLKPTAAVFSIGSQKRLNEWFARLPGGKFGIHVLTEPPKALPPTLTLYVGSGVIDVDKLEIPAKVKVERLAVLRLRIAVPERAIVVANDDRSHFHVVIENASDSPQKMIDEWNSWGYFNLRFEHILPSGEKRTMEKLGREWSKNFLTTTTLAAGEAAVWDVYLDNRVWSSLPVPEQGEAKVRIRAIFEQKAEKGVDAWVGRITSPEEEVTFRNGRQ